ncbi:hypothetical protein EPN90_04090, partial [Patescibacteria group bacterium]
MHRFRHKSFTFLTLITVGLAAATAALAWTTGYLYPIEDDLRTNWNVEPRTSPTHYETIDEEPCNGTSDYIYSLDPASQETFKIDLSGVPVGAQITAINVAPCAGRHDAGTTASYLRLYYKWNGADSDYGPTYTLTDPTPQMMATSTFETLLNHSDSSDELRIGVNHENG